MAGDRLVGRECPWRSTTEVPKFGPIDARATFPLIFFLFHMRLWTLELVLGTVVLFVVLQIWRISPLEAIKAVALSVSTVGFRHTHVGHRTELPDADE